MCGHESKPRGNHVASRRLVRTCRESLSLGLLVSSQGSHELQSVGLAPVVPQLVVDKHVEVTSQHQPLPVPGGHVEALVVAAGLTAHHNPDLPKWLKDKCVLSRCCNLYNSLPPALRRPLKQDEEPKLESFKTELDKWLVTIPDRPRIPSRPKVAESNSILHQKDYKL